MERAMGALNRQSSAAVDRSTPERLARARIGWSVALLRVIFPRFGCATILIFAAAFKTYELVRNPAVGFVYGSRWLQSGLIEYECVLAAWLLSGYRPILCRRVSLVTFMGFGCYSLYLALSGTASCGCFGQLRITPWMAFVLDTVLVMLLWQWNPFLGGGTWRFEDGPLRPQRIPSILRAMASVALVGVPMFAIAAWGRNTAVIDEKSLVNQDVVVLEPDQWVGKRFPLFNYIDIGKSLSTGSWVLVFYRHDCPKCHEAIPKYERLARQLRESGQPVHVALIQIPPYGSLESVASMVCWRGNLDEHKEWFMITPSEVRITDGQVTATSSEK
jgi:thiol-disulfide isomerase/thioredoxin